MRSLLGQNLAARISYKVLTPNAVFHSHDHMQTELVFSVCSFFLTPQSENSKQKHFVRKFPINFQLMTNSNSRLSDQLFN